MSELTRSHNFLVALEDARVATEQAREKWLEVQRQLPEAVAAAGQEGLDPSKIRELIAGLERAMILGDSKTHSLVKETGIFSET